MESEDQRTNAPAEVSSQSAVSEMVKGLMARPFGHALIIVISYTLLYLIFFSPALVRGYLLAVGADGQQLYLPDYHARKVLWDTSIFAGFPMMADPQVMSWYPPALLLSQFSGTWNLFILLAFVAASSFMYGYVHTITNSRFAGLFSGIVFGMSGFMMAHLGHAVIVQTVAWIPLTMWSLEQLRQKWSPWWFMAASIGVALSFLGGHTPVFTYGCMLGIAYAIVLGWNAPSGRWRYYLACAGLLMLSFGLAAVQIMPTMEIVGQSVRTGYKFSDFVSHSLPPIQLLMLIFPKLFGALQASGALPYYGAENLTELTGYVGLLTIMLAGIGVLKWPHRVLSLFWLSVALLALPLAMGDATPLARIIYRVPILSQFRAPGRYLLVFTFGMSVLSGLGIAHLWRRSSRNSFIVRTTLYSSVFLLGCVLVVLALVPNLSALAAHKQISHSDVVSWTRREIVVTLIIFVAAVLALVQWSKVPNSSWRRLLLLLVLVVDLGRFGFFYDWQYTRLDKNALAAPLIAEHYKNLLQTSNQRVLPIHGALSLPDEMPPNLSRVWGVPSASGYNSLILTRYSKLVSMVDVGSLTRPLWWEPTHQGMNLVATRYLFMPASPPLTDHENTAWSKEDIQLALGSGCVEGSRDSATFNLRPPLKSTTIGIVARLACSSHVPDGTEIARVSIRDADGNRETHGFVAGRDVSEWAYDCRSVTPVMKHQRTNIFRSYPASLSDEPCEGHYYVSKLKLDRVQDVKSVEFRWTGSPPGTMLLEKVSLINETDRTSAPVDPMTLGDRWKFEMETPVARVYENLNAMPRAWLVPTVINIDSEAALKAISTSKLPDGSDFQPLQTALVEESLDLPSQPPDPAALATVARLSDNYMEVRTSSKLANFLVTSDVYYPGWQATIDDRPVKLYRADYALRGVLVPAGQHVVRFEYCPRRFLLGAAVSLLSLTVLGALAFMNFSSRKRTMKGRHSVGAPS